VLFRRWETDVVGDDASLSVEARTAKRAAMRRATLHLVLGVGALDTVAMLGYYYIVKNAEPRTQTIFTGVWTVLTVIVVMVLLKRVRRVRFGPRMRR
jgi:drug/metabolite transporter (DMT)-like permease